MSPSHAACCPAARMSRAPWGRLGVVVAGRLQRELGEARPGLAAQGAFGRL